MTKKKTRKRTWTQKEKTKLKTSFKRVKECFGKATTFTLIIWFAYIANQVLFFVDLNQFGLVSRSFSGLVGIITMPFLHGNLPHIFNNTIGLWVLLSALFLSHKFDSADKVLLKLIIVSGAILWLFGLPHPDPNAVRLHIGASGLVYALATYAIVTGFRLKHYGLIIMSVFVMAQCGAGLLAGFVPEKGVSWDGHVAGAIAGLIIAATAHKKNLRTNMRQR